jgi:hypothetical protein
MAAPDFEGYIVNSYFSGLFLQHPADTTLSHDCCEEEA